MSGRIQDAAKLSACVEGRKLHRKINQYTVVIIKLISIEGQRFDRLLLLGTSICAVECYHLNCHRIHDT